MLIYNQKNIWYQLSYILSIPSKRCTVCCFLCCVPSFFFFFLKGWKTLHHNSRANKKKLHKRMVEPSTVPFSMSKLGFSCSYPFCCRKKKDISPQLHKIHSTNNSKENRLVSCYPKPALCCCSPIRKFPDLLGLSLPAQTSKNLLVRTLD